MEEVKKPQDRTINVRVISERETVPEKSFWKKEFWKSGLWVTILTSIISAAIVYLQYKKEEKRADTQLAIEKTNQEHEVRLKYLDVVLKQTNDIHEKESILRFLSMNSSDTSLGKWAKLELDAVKDLARTQATKDSIAREYASLIDSVKAMKHSVDAGKSEKEKLQTSLTRLGSQLDSLNFEVYRKSKMALIKQSVKPFGFEDIEFEDLQPWPSCKVESIKSISNSINENKACLDSYLKQDVTKLAFKENRWTWETKYESIRFDKEFDKPFKFSKSVEFKASCLCDFEKINTKDTR